MDRYLGMGLSHNPATEAMTASIKLLATFRTSSLPEQRTPYPMDLFDLNPVDPTKYQKLVGGLIWLFKLRFEPQLAVIMACSHNSNPTQGDFTKAIRLLAYLKGAPDLGPTWHTTEGPVLIASCDSAFAVHPKSGGSQLSISYRIRFDNAQFHVVSQIQTSNISLNPTHAEYAAFSAATELIKFYRTYLAWLGYPQKDPTPSRTIALLPSASSQPRTSLGIPRLYSSKMVMPVLPIPTRSSHLFMFFLKDSPRTSMQSHQDPRTSSQKELST